MLLISLFFLIVFFLMGAFFLTATMSAFRRNPVKENTRLLDEAGGLFFFRGFHRYFFPDNEYESIFFAIICAENVVRFLYAVCAISFLSQTQMFRSEFSAVMLFWMALNIVGFILASFIFGDYLPRLFGTRLPQKAIRFCIAPSSLFLFLIFPITYPFLKLAHSFSRALYMDHSQSPDTQVKHEILEILHEAELDTTLDPQEKRLITSILNFRTRIAREIMVPRVDLFALPASTPIKEAAEKIRELGFSRIPIYEDTIDKITGVVLYKDILCSYEDYIEGNHDAKILEVPLQTIQKPVLYTPETKKISLLLQDFRRAQTHLAIVVDEYGGTEGIVTIEDILEEIVGEIADEYDIEEHLFRRQSDGSWVVDGRMNILDIEEEIGIKIPQEEDYDTLGGYIAHCAGTIPSPGFVIHHDDFEMEILSANERSVEKVRVKAIAMNKPQDSTFDKKTP